MLGFNVETTYELNSNNGGVDKVAFMSLNSMLFELYQLDRYKATVNVGPVNHVAVRVNNLAELQLLIEEQGIKIIKGPQLVPFGSNGMTYLTIEGPDIERIEFDQFH